MEIYIVRHGKTVWNEQKLLQGSVDVELNIEGRAVAGQLGENLETVAFDRIYSSPLMRAYETANLIRGHRNIPIIRDERLRELCFGENEGKNALEIREDENNPFHHFFSRPELYTAPEGGETLEHLCKRAKEFLEQEIEPQAEQLERIMIVAHGAINKALMCHIKQHDISAFWSGGLQRNCSMMIVRLGADGYQVVEE